jgi:calcineurin-like phosphoesterase family protein
MNSVLKERWNDRVQSGDLVYFLGDFAMGPMVDERFIVDMLKSLKGDIAIVPGNHDQQHKKYMPKGLQQIVQDNRLPHVEILPDIFDLTVDGTPFVLCHYPMTDWNGKFHGSIHLHGHCHTQHDSVRIQDAANKRRYDVGVDMYGGPVELTGDCRYLNDPKGWQE